MKWFKREPINDFEIKADELLGYIRDKNFDKNILEVVLALTLTNVCKGNLNKAKKMIDRF